MKKIPILLVIFAWSFAGARAQTNDTLLDVDLLPNTSYEVQATVNTPLLSSLVALLTGGPNPIQIVDDLGNVLAELPVDDLLSALTDADGAPAVVNLEVNTGDTVGEASQLLIRVLDTPLLQVLGVTAAVVPPNRPPNVANIKKRLVGAHRRILDIRGKAADPDGSVRKVEILYRGKLRRAKGTGNWKSAVYLADGRTHRVIVRAIDNEGKPGAKKQVVVRRGN